MITTNGEADLQSAYCVYMNQIPAQSKMVMNSKKKKAGATASKKGGQPPVQQQRKGVATHELDDDDLPTLQEIDSSLTSLALSQHFANSINLNGGSHGNSASPSDLLSTASDLYRQIEAAAASALSTHPSFAASFPPPPSSSNGQSGAATDEAYWTSLPQHLRQFIRSALPLAAGLTSTGAGNGTSLGIGVGVTGVNGQPLPPLTHEQLSSAAAQLAQVVQSNWGSLGLGSLPPGAQAQLGAAAARSVSSGTVGGATISLGSFPVTMPTREQMEAAIGSVGGMGLADLRQHAARVAAGDHDESCFDLTEDEDEEDDTENAAARKKKNKKNKKKAAVAPTPLPTKGLPSRAIANTLASDPIRRPTPPTTTNRGTVPSSKSTIPPPLPPLVGANGKARAPIASLAPTIAAGKQPATASNTPKTHTSDNYATAKPPPPGAYPHPPAPVASLPVVVQSNTPSIAPKAGPSSEREKIRDFWLGLKEAERRALVKVEKDAVLRKMKEQQRSGCSCAVCGRKR